MATERMGNNDQYVLTQGGLRDDEGLLALPLDENPPWIQGERRLLVEVLERAWQDLMYTDKAIAQAAAEYLLDEEATTKDLFSLPWICMYLDIDLEDVRRRVRARIRPSVESSEVV